MKLSIKNLQLSLLFIATIFLQFGCDTEKQRIIFLNNNKIKLGFSDKNGALVTFKDLVNSFNQKKYLFFSLNENLICLPQEKQGFIKFN